MALATLAAAGAAGAQAGRRAPTPEPRTIVGIVTDTLGRPLDSAEVRMENPRRSAFTHADGTFALENARPARYTLIVRKAGHLPQTRRVAVPASGVSVSFQLVPFVFGLPAAITVATRVGIAGIVADTAHRPIAGAEVNIIGSSHRVATDSAGKFYADVNPGRYLLRVTRKGYRTQTASVTLPEHEGRDVAVWLRETRLADRVRDNVAAVDLNLRLAMRNPARSRLFTREDMLALNVPELERIASIGAVQRVDDSCEATIDGGPYSVPLWTLTANDVEFIEVYLPKPARARADGRASGIPGTTGGAVTARGSRSAGSASCPAAVFVWLRR